MADDFELEDIVSEDDYFAAFRAEYPHADVEKRNAPAGKRTKYYEDAVKERLNIGFNKRRTAAKLKDLVLADRVEKSTSENLGKLVQAITAALDSQVQPKA